METAEAEFRTATRHDATHGDVAAVHDGARAHVRGLKASLADYRQMFRVLGFRV